MCTKICTCICTQCTWWYIVAIAQNSIDTRLNQACVAVCFWTLINDDSKVQVGMEKLHVDMYVYCAIIRCICMFACITCYPWPWLWMSWLSQTFGCGCMQMTPQQCLPYHRHSYGCGRLADGPWHMHHLTGLSKALCLDAHSRHPGSQAVTCNSDLSVLSGLPRPAQYLQ